MNVPNDARNVHQNVNLSVPSDGLTDHLSNLAGVCDVTQNAANLISLSSKLLGRSRRRNLVNVTYYYARALTS